MFSVLGGNWDPTDKEFSSVNSYRQDLLPTCKAFPKETTTCIWFTQSYKGFALVVKAMCATQSSLGFDCYSAVVVIQ